MASIGGLGVVVCDLRKIMLEDIYWKSQWGKRLDIALIFIILSFPVTSKAENLCNFIEA